MHLTPAVRPLLTAACAAALLPLGLAAQSQADSAAVLHLLTDSLRADHAAVLVTRFHCSRATRAYQPEACATIGNGRWSFVEARQLLLSLSDSLPIRSAEPGAIPLPICSWWARPDEDLAGQLVTLSAPQFRGTRAEIEVRLICGEAEGPRLSLADYRYVFRCVEGRWQIVEKRLELIT